MNHYKKQIKYHQEAEAAAKEMCDDKLAKKHEAHLEDYEKMQSQVKAV